MIAAGRLAGFDFAPGAALTALARLAAGAAFAARGAFAAGAALRPARPPNVGRQLRDQPPVEVECGLRPVLVGHQAVLRLEVRARGVAVAQVEPAVVGDVEGPAEVVDGVDHRGERLRLALVRAARACRPAVLLDVDRHRLRDAGRGRIAAERAEGVHERVALAARRVHRREERARIGVDADPVE